MRQDNEAMLHTLKLNIKYECPIKYGYKRFEVRKNDRDFQVGDIIEFIGVDDNGNILGTTLPYYQITYILKDFPQGLKKGYVVLGIEEDDTI